MENPQNENTPVDADQTLTLKEQRQLKRQQKLANRSQKEQLAQKESWYRAALWIFVVVVLCASVFALIKLGNTGTTETGTGPNGGDMTNILSTVTSADWMRDNIHASTTLIEYGDFQCPACGAFYPLTKQVDQQFGSNLRFIFREFPLSQLHPNAEIAAQAAEAAGKQGQFWQMHDLLYQNQTTWADLSTADATATFMSYAKQLGINIPQFTSDFNSPAIADKIQQSYNDGISSYGIDSTPTFFLNDEKLPPPDSAAQFIQEIQTAIQNANGTTTATSTKTSSY